jgi:hypothetical protein
MTREGTKSRDRKSIFECGGSDQTPHDRLLTLRQIIPGAVFPDYELSDHTAKHRKLSELQGQHPMVLVLRRGGYCPKDRRQHDGLTQLDGELKAACGSKAARNASIRTAKPTPKRSASRINKPAANHEVEFVLGE